MGVENQNALYREMLPVWEMMDDICAGERVVKSKGTVYLPMIYACEDGCENQNRYEAYKNRAVFYPIAKDTLNTNVGLAFAEDPNFAHDGLEFLKKDADGAGNSIYQINQMGLGSQLKYGRGGFFVDFPKTDGAVTKKDIESGIRPFVVFYNAKQIINWRVKKINGMYKTSLVVLYEVSSQVDPQDEFNEKVVETYRVLRLDEENHYCVQTHVKVDDKFTASDIVYPTDSSGRKWNEIPFIAIGSKVNDFAIDEIPLEPVASVNLAHYRNSAEYEQSLFYAGQIQPVITNLDETWRDWLHENGFKLGSASALMLPQGATFNYVQAQETSLPKQGMDDKLNYMQLLGARMTDRNEVAKTATQSDNEQMTKHSVLSLCVANLNEAAEIYLKWVAKYIGFGDKAVFSIKQDFAVGKLTLEQLKYWQSEYASENISAETYHEIKMNGKVPEIAYKDEQKRIQKQKLGIAED